MLDNFHTEKHIILIYISFHTHFQVLIIYSIDILFSVFKKYKYNKN